MVIMNGAEGKASEVLEVNFFVGIILPRATPAWSGVMHSMSSMPRHSSQPRASFQLRTPRSFLTKAGLRTRVPRPTGRTAFLSEAIDHQLFPSAKYSEGGCAKERAEGKGRAAPFIDGRLRSFARSWAAAHRA